MTAVAAAVERVTPRAAQYREFVVGGGDQREDLGSETSWMRSQALVVGFTRAERGDLFFRPESQSGEYMLVTLDTDVVLQVHHEAGGVIVMNPSVVIVPAGKSRLEVREAGTFAQIFAASTAPDLAAKCANAAEYDEPDPNVADFVSWPEPAEGPEVRVYTLADYPIEPNRLGRIFRCSTIMVNVFGFDDKPRNPSALSPHHHEDFEQVSLQIKGDYVHHMRVPWTPDSTTWRDDEHQACSAPAMIVIPPTLIHTSQGVGNMRHWLIDVFSPPRADFSARPGWVLNASDYPVPT